MPKYVLSNSDLDPNSNELKEEIEALKKRSEELAEMACRTEKERIDDILFSKIEELYSMDNDENILIEAGEYWEDRNEDEKALFYYYKLLNLNSREKINVDRVSKLLISMAWDYYFFDNSVMAEEHAIKARELLKAFCLSNNHTSETNPLIEEAEKILKQIAADSR